MGKNVCPYMGATPYFDIIMPAKCPNFNLFGQNLFYMINRPKIHYVNAKLQVYKY